MQFVSYKNVNLRGGFVHSKQQLNRNVTLDAVYKRFEETGRVKAFNCDWKEGEPQRPHFFWDSDIAKWIEGASYTIAKTGDENLAEKIEAIIDQIEKNQHDDGYFNIYYTVVSPGNRFTNRDHHELYCAGHLIEAAVAYFDATGRDRFLKIMEKYVDLIYKIFVEDKSASFITPGHEEIEIALIRLYRLTKNEKHLNLAKFFINSRGEQDEQHIFRDFLPEYSQSHLPVREQKEAVGHAVRAVYLYTAMALLANETKDKELFDACETLFKSITENKMYITGGIGSDYNGETFARDYYLPNDTAYNETCASIALMLFARNMLEGNIDAKYADIIERELYNGMISGLSLDGKAFFYENPLEINLENHIKNPCAPKPPRLPITQRKEVFSCSCCPPNINRILELVSEYFYSFDGDNYYIHQFGDSEMKMGDKYISQKTNYPLDGKIEIECENIPSLMIRIPAWCDNFTVSCDYETCGGYIRISSPKNITVDFEIKPFLIYSSNDALYNIGKVALQRGPVVYCIEAVDNGEKIHSLYIDENLQTTEEFDEYFGLYTITAKGYKREAQSELYSKTPVKFVDKDIKFIPYSAFANRGESDMRVWVNVK